MAKKSETSEAQPETVRVYPSPHLAETEYVAGVGEDGADLPAEEAEALHAAGLVVKTKPKSPGAPAEPEVPAT